MRLRRLSVLASMVATIAVAPAFATVTPAQANFDTTIAATKAAMMSDPEIALINARKAGVLAKSLSGVDAAIASATSQWLSGEALTRLGKPDQAAPIIAAALASVKAKKPHSKLHGDLLKASASIAAKTGHIEAALPMLHQAFAIYQRLGEGRAQAMILQNIGSLYYDARDYPRTINYYDQAAAAFTEDPAITVSLHNNRGNALKEMGRGLEAEKEYAEAIKIAREMDSPFLEVNILSNLASAYLLNNKIDKASAAVAEGLRGAAGAGAEWRPFLLGTAAQVAQKRGDLQQAAALLNQTFDGVDTRQSTMPYRDFHETAAQVFAALGDKPRAYEHLLAFKRLDDSGRELAASTNHALMSAQFDAANQQVRISKLEAQQVQRDLVLEQSQNRLRGFAFVIVVGGGGAAAVIMAMLFAFATTRKRRREISEANVQLSHAVNHDLLTSLPNRTYFRDIVTNALTTSLEAGDRCAVLLVDLDRFKWVNDTLGHSAGDELLCAVARSLETVAGEGGHAVRLGGDEFAVIVPHAGDDEALITLGNRIVEQLSAPHIIAGSTVNIGATVGVAAGPKDGADVTSLTRSADLALYAGKANGRGCTIRYAPDMQEEIEERRALENDLRYALERGEIQIAYQAILDADREEMLGYEALLRWEHPTRGAISPSHFIPIAEEAGLINQIGDWVLRTACMEAATWPDHLWVAVNLSAIQVAGQGLISGVMNALASSGLAAERLELEVTESVFLGKDGKAEETLERIRSLGVKLALDDFGTGFSSLGYLRRATFSTIKIDRSFVKSASQNSHDSIAIIRAIVSLADDLGMKTTAEGVETQVELAKMRELGCTQVQGYFFSKPTLVPQTGKTEAAHQAAA
jgi:diguanylate cyclase (GGDEF)-like protein